MRRRDFIKVVAGSVAAWPLAVRAQQPAMPAVGFVRDGSADGNARFVAAFRKGLSENGYIDGQNVTVEYHWLEGQYDRLPALIADLVRRHGRRPRLSSASAETRSGWVLSPVSPDLAVT